MFTPLSTGCVSLQVLSYSSHFAHVRNSPVCVLVSVGDMLEACRQVGGVVSRELQDQFCTLMKILFQSLLTSPSWIVKQRTLEAFKNFAQVCGVYMLWVGTCIRVFALYAG